MSPAFVKGGGEQLGSDPRSGSDRGDASCVAGHRPHVVFDRYRVVAKASEAVDTVRRAEAYVRRWCYGAKRSRYGPIKAFVTAAPVPWCSVSVGA